MVSAKCINEGDSPSGEAPGGNRDHVTFIMAQKHTSGANSIPRLVVRIAGSKQVEHFIEEPHEKVRLRMEMRLCSAVREELPDWRLSSLRSTEDEVAALDLTLRGTLNRSKSFWCVGHSGWVPYWGAIEYMKVVNVTIVA
ncbi:hypothetical protein EYF80_014995 [Liparis tanakae]|uniref:Uncharacterized protein n=1 Tax=Liparis tanakae TaxID=230148 RepID=A0A4Z2I9Q7_9TELE|nr:hypothetical protein EYF80_014995 [Liparis tanakae]